MRSALEAAWIAAGEVAAISDDLLVPESVHAFIDRERSAGGRTARDGGSYVIGIDSPGDRQE